MAASQARLLSITARLTDNELRSQTITNSKLRLAEKSSEASSEGGVGHDTQTPNAFCRTLRQWKDEYRAELCAVAPAKRRSRDCGRS